MKEITSLLDLDEYLQKLSAHFARQKPLHIEGDIHIHYNFIKALAQYEVVSAPNVTNLDTQLAHLQKFGVLKLYEIYEFVKIVNYFFYLKSFRFEGILQEWFAKVEIPQSIEEIVQSFDKDGVLKNDLSEEYAQLNYAIKINKEQTKEAMIRIINTQKIQPYLVDRQIHFINENEALLLRGGFNHFLKGSVSARSASGFFYVVPESIEKLNQKKAELQDKKKQLIFGFCKAFSSTLQKSLLFLKYINKEFDRYDHYSARASFARGGDLNFILPKKDDAIILSNFYHPAINDPKPVSVDFSKKVLMITGVNAGGKTMLLKSIISAVFMSKYLIPMRIDSKKSHIGSFRELVAIIDDPQNVKNDISTFAGRMSEFSKLFGKTNTLVGVDEIELGTDSDEAATLYKTMIDKLKQKQIKIVITTHHKRLASMMAVDDAVELVAALYDEKQERPTYEFLQGTIGKSYAFETALRYGIPPHIIAEVRKNYGEDKEKLNDLIQKNIDLELTLKKKIKHNDALIEKNEKALQNLQDERVELAYGYEQKMQALEKEYDDAINEAKKAAKEQNPAQIHRILNRAHERKNTIQVKSDQPQTIEVGDFVKYNNSKGKVLSLRQNDAFIECDGIKLRVPLSSLRLTQKPPKKKSKKLKLDVQKPSSASVKLDLHGLRVEEALDVLDQYLSDALITGYDEVLIFHGVGSGKLAFAVKEFLKLHPKVISFSDAPANMGGYGATVVRM
jgi:DNA mismatch repair protein MutS2